MKKAEIMKNVSKTFYKVSFQFKKHSPEILIVAGVVGTVAGAVMACRATTKVGEILDEAHDTINKIHDYAEKPDENLSQPYSEEDGQKDLLIVYVQTGLKFAKIYAPAVLLGALSITAILTSNNILRKRNIALAAAYATVDKTFKEYRSRVVKHFGEDVDHELRYNITSKKVDKVVTDEETGKEKKVKESIMVAGDPNEYSDYARFYDDGCNGWTKNPEYNLMFLKAQQAYANDVLKVQGFLFLNDVYELLGIPKTRAGQVVGWVYNPDTPMGDNYIDFGIFDTNRQKAIDFVNGYERTILLDFNVDGPILDLIDNI